MEKHDLRTFFNVLLKLFNIKFCFLMMQDAMGNFATLKTL